MPEAKTTILNLRLAIACAMANERATARAFIEQLLAEASRFKDVAFIAVFDRACKDGTIDIVRDMAARDRRIKVVFDANSTRVVDANLTSFREALATGFEWILDINAGFRHQPSDLVKFLGPIEEGYDCVFDSRFMPGGTMKHTRVQRALLSKGGTALANFLLRTKLTDMTSGYQMFRRDALEAVLARGIRSCYHFLQTEMKTYCRNYRIKEVPIQYATPSASLPLKVVIDALRQLVRLSVLSAAGRL